MYNCLIHLEQIAKNLEVLNKTAIIENGIKISYDQLYKKSKMFGISLLNYGILPKDKIILSLPDSADFIVGFLGCLYVGVIPILDIRKKSHKVFTDIDRTIKNFYKEISFTPNTSEDEEAFILCTSGTTGKTKYVVHSQKSICGTGLQFGPYINISKFDILLSASKMTHAYGLGNSISIPLCHGATTIIELGLATPEKIQHHILNNKVTILFGVPRHFASILNSKVSLSNSSLRICVSAGETLPENIKQSFVSKFECNILDSVGSTELLGFCLCEGKLVKGCEIKIIDSMGNEVEDGIIGELTVKSPFSSTKYYKDESSTKLTFNNGWIRTYDLCIKTGKNYIHKGRKNDCIKINGIYISLTYLENKINLLNSVLESAIVVKQNKFRLNRIVIYIILRENFLPDEEYINILNAVKNETTGFNTPFMVKLVDSFPKTSSGKIHKYRLR